MQARRLMLAAIVVAAGMSLEHTASAHGGGHGGPPSHGGHAAEERHGNRPPQRFSFDLSGSQVPGGGDPNGRGRALMELDPTNEVVCLRTDWRNLAGEVTSIHVHHAGEGQTGPHQIEILNDESLAGRSNQVELCVQVAGGHEAGGHEAGHHEAGHHEGHAADGGGGAGAGERIQQIIDDPADYYLNIHSSAHPDGAIRGQLAG